MKKSLAMPPQALTPTILEMLRQSCRAKSMKKRTANIRPPQMKKRLTLLIIIIMIFRELLMDTR